MAEISLRAYQEQLAERLTDGRHDQVIAHARHILKSHPKNLRAYRQLSAALIASSRWEEAAEVLRRLLGALPQDLRVHAQLARAYRQLEEFDRAIWHAERALDQQSDNPEIISLIRSLYRDGRGLEIERLQLSSTALAKQHIRSNLLADALDVIDKAIERNPGRIDLQLLRARALWLDGQRAAAAETADDVLQQLPWSLAANRMMAELWLSEARPSDAQQYLRRIEALDPYLAHQLATGEAPIDALVTLDELEIASLSGDEQAIVNADWLENLDDAQESDQARELDALFGADEAERAHAPPSATADLDELLSNEEVDALFDELIGADSSRAQSQTGDDGASVIIAMAERGLFEDSDGEAADADAALPPDLAADIAAQASPAGDLEGMDRDLANLLDQLDDEDDDNTWLQEIQQDSLNLLDEESLDYLEDLQRDWVKPPESTESAGAPWLSANLEEQDEADADFDLFAEDEGLQKLLKATSDTEPLDLSDIEDWLYADEAEPDQLSAEDIDKLVELEDGALDQSTWLDEAAEPATSELPLGSAPAVAEDENLRNAQLIDSWGQELGIDDDEDDDPYIDWLSEDASDDIADEPVMLAAEEPDPAPAAQAAEPDPVTLTEGDPSETARAWGLNDEGQLKDFVEEEVGLADAEVAPSWLNAMVPGIDRETDAEPEKELEFAQPVARTDKDFGWVNEIVEEETGEMAALDLPAPAADLPYFRFSNPPLWLAILRGDHSPQPPIDALVPAVALSVAENLDELELDDLTFDGQFDFDTPTDKMDAINLDDDGVELDFAALEWDDYFNFESPTEKTIAITLDEDPAQIRFEELGVEDEDFDFDTPTEKMPAISLEKETDPLEFDDIGLDDDPSLIASPEPKGNDSGEWLEYGQMNGDDDFAPDDRDKSRGATPM